MSITNSDGTQSYFITREVNGVNHVENLFSKSLLVLALLLSRSNSLRVTEVCFNHLLRKVCKCFDIANPDINRFYKWAISNIQKKDQFQKGK